MTARDPADIVHEALNSAFIGREAGLAALAVLEQQQLRLAQGLRVIRDTSGEYTSNVAARALIEAGVPDPPEEDHP